jgi:hypothetical protein
VLCAAIVATNANWNSDVKSNIVAELGCKSLSYHQSLGCRWNSRDEPPWESQHDIDAIGLRDSILTGGQQQPNPTDWQCCCLTLDGLHSMRTSPMGVDRADRLTLPEGGAARLSSVGLDSCVAAKPSILQTRCSDPSW